MNFGQPALRRLLERIRGQKEQWNRREPPAGPRRAEPDNPSIESGSLVNPEWEEDANPEPDRSGLLEAETETGSFLCYSSVRSELLV